MITAVFERNESVKELTLKVSGHASFDEIGKDIVCASASILTYTLAKVSEAMFEKGYLEKYPVLRLNGGDALIECRCKTYFSFADAMQAFDMTKVGFTLLAENYPQNVNVEAYSLLHK